MKKLATLLLAGTLVGGFCAVATTRVVLQDIADTLPPIHPADLAASVSGDGATTILDADGHETDSFAVSRRMPLRYDQIPPLVANAFIAAEDRHFWSHDGVDFQAMGRAALTDLTTGRHEGGSGITQQVVKNFVTGNDRSMGRKLREALLAMRLTQEMDRRDILTVYLNGIWLGHGAYGVGAGARAWFHKDVASLTPAEAAFLAGLARGPALMDPAAHPLRARARRRYVLDRMAALGVITPSQVSTADAAGLPTPDSIANTGTGRSYYTETVRHIILGHRGASGVYSGGSLVQTWQSGPLQAVADQALRHGLLAYDARHGWRGDLRDLPDSWWTGRAISCQAGRCLVQPSTASSPVAVDNPYGRAIRAGSIVAVDEEGHVAERPAVDGAVVIMDKNGHVLAESGGFWRGQSTFDRATQSLRQTGSTIKPFIALAATAQGFTPDTIVADVPVSIAIPGTNQTWEPGGDGHDDGMGLMTLRDALAQSRNQAFVRLGNDVGLEATYAMFRAVGLYDSDQPLSPASLLGATETSLLRMTSGYATLLANNGHAVHPSFIAATSDLPPQTDENGIPDTAAVMAMLGAVVSGGTAEQAFIGLPPEMMTLIGGKTGTSNDVMDSWFVGHLGGLVIGVHAGMDHPASLGEHEFGSTIAAPIAAEIMKKAYAAGWR